jgi:hypothetical protein
MSMIPTHQPLTHVRIVNGEAPQFITVRAALDEIEAGMMGPAKRLVRQMSAVRSSANIEYRDGRKVDIRPATPEEIAEYTAQAGQDDGTETAAPEWRTLKGVAAPFDTYVWPSDYRVLRPSGDRRTPHGDRVTIIELVRGRFSNTGILADGRTVNFGGVASRQWIACDISNTLARRAG